MSASSQWGEGSIIREYFGDYKGRFLDLGAYDGKNGSNTYDLALENWKGVCVEANPLIFSRLLETYEYNKNVICVNAAISHKPGLSYFCNSDQCGRCSASGDFMVATMTPKMLLDSVGGGFDFVSIDIEGAEIPIMVQLPYLLRDTKLICFEDDLPNTRNPEHKKLLLHHFANMGFAKIVGTTSTKDRSANTLVAR